MKNETGLCSVCSSWAREASMTFPEHHPDCPKGWSPDALRLIGALVNGMERWASDEDGIHPDAWGAYVTARAMIGRPLTAEEIAKAER